MSIPPLVCSTPPPPDQCVEDKDFDIHYNLSQEEDDENNDYDYGNFSTYNHFQSHVSGSIKEDTPNRHVVNEHSATIERVNIEPQQQTEPAIETNNCHVEETNEEPLKNSNNEMKNENNLKCDEDIEDLNLKLDEDSTASNIPINEDNDVNKYDFCIAEKGESLHIPSIDSDVNEDNISSSVSDKIHESDSKVNYGDEIESLEDDIAEFHSHDTIVGTTEDVDTTITVTQVDKPSAESTESVKEKTTLPDDDFGDFDDFQSVSPETKPNNIVIIKCDNPWDEKKIEETEFGDFTANFDQVASEENTKSTEETFSTATINKFEENTKETVSQDDLVDDDDDFGDFDDFKSSNVVSEIKQDISHEDPASLCQQLPVLNLELSDKGHQIVDSINQVLNSIFLEDIPEPNSEFKCKLESFLSETWGHLMETDVRQPYIVNWNNALGQKTLLRALSIDSRNILFGPKWSHNMPKYAANLSTAPLQPKPVLQSSTSQSEDTTSDKIPSKVGTWIDPFTSDGQESCNTENEGGTIEREPVNADVFESGLPTKPDTIYTSNLTVQPLRQISLPDTHIFTPTDSETPRSKTIHYDTGPTVLLPDPPLDKSHVFHSENSMANPDTNTATTNSDDNDYWEFQDFKCTPKLNTEAPAVVMPRAPSVAPTSDGQSKIDTTYQTELLQPIKMDPVAPKLNWPDPGEVKEVFDDFTDFVSSPGWCKEKQDIITSQKTSHNSEPNTFPNEKVEKTQAPKSNVTKDLDDEFDTFQYALPSQNTNETPSIVNLTKINNKTQISFPPKPLSEKQKSKHDETFSKLNIDMSETISSTHSVISSKALTKNVLNMSNATELSRNVLPFGSQTQNILQPIAASSNNQSQQNTGQILQPLTLESFSQINWPSPGIDLQDLSRFNPVETLHSLKSDLSASGSNKSASPIHSQKGTVNNQSADEEVWGEFVSSKPKPQPPVQKKANTFADDDEWTDFVSSPSVKPQNGLNTISLNVHTNLNLQKNTYHNKLTAKSNQSSLDIPTLNYITPKTNNHKAYNDRHFQNL